MNDRFKPHPKHPDFLIGKTYKFRDYKVPEEEKTRLRIEKIVKAQD